VKLRDLVHPQTTIVADVIGDRTRRMIRRDQGSVIARTLAAASLVMLALLVACDSNTPNRRSPSQNPTSRVAHRTCGFQKVFIAARNYAADVKPFRIESTPSTDGNGLDGKSAIWRASFASATQHGVKPFFWSGSNAPDAPSRGVSPGNEDVYNPGNASTQIFDVAFLKVDSDQAFAEAQKHGGDKVLEKDPTLP